MIKNCLLYAICSILFFGTVRAASPAEIVSVLMKADQGDVTAQFNLGQMYEKGDGVKQNYVEAVKWYESAAYQGLSPAQRQLGIMYEKGLGVAKNNAEASKWYNLASHTGNNKAHHDSVIAFNEQD